jgi:hypothetical protein
MLHQSFEYENITKGIETVKDELMNLSEVHHIKIEDSERGLEKCKVSNMNKYYFTPWFSILILIPILILFKLAVLPKNFEINIPTSCFRVP